MWAIIILSKKIVTEIFSKSREIKKLIDFYICNFVSFNLITLFSRPDQLNTCIRLL